MGERLVIDVQDKTGKHLATAYYHWSGFTISGLATLLSFNRAKQPLIDLDIDSLTLVQDAVYRLSATGAGFTKKIAAEDDDGKIVEVDNPVFERFNAPVCHGRDSGILDIFEKGMQESLKWSEHTVIVTINDDHSLSYNLYDAFWEVEDDREQWYDPDHKFLDIPIHHYNIRNLTPTQFENLVTIFEAVHPEEYDHDVSYSYIFDDGSHLQFVE